MVQKFRVSMTVEAARARFVQEFVRRSSGSVGLETNVAGFADARRRFFIAIQGWEKTPWMRPLLTRLEGYFQRSETNTYTDIYISRRGLALPLTVLALLIPYGVARTLITELPLTPFQIFMLAVSGALVALIGIVLTFLERRTYKLLTDVLLAAFDHPDLLF